jgi:hypothetical protein
MLAIPFVTVAEPRLSPEAVENATVPVAVSPPAELMVAVRVTNWYAPQQPAPWSVAEAVTFVLDSKSVVPFSEIVFVLLAPFALLVIVTVPVGDPDCVGVYTIPI